MFCKKFNWPPQSFDPRCIIPAWKFEAEIGFGVRMKKAFDLMLKLMLAKTRRFVTSEEKQKRVLDKVRHVGLF